MNYLTVLTCFLSVALPLVTGYGSGAPATACSGMVPGHNVSSNASLGAISAQTTTAPYTVTANATTFMASTAITVTITGTSGATFQGFFLQARKTSDGTTRVGLFSSPSPTNTTQLRVCTGTSNDAVTHANQGSNAVNMTQVTAIWTAPATTTNSDLKFYLTVAENHDVFWTGLMSSALTSSDSSAGSRCALGYIVPIISLISATILWDM